MESQIKKSVVITTNFINKYVVNILCPTLKVTLKEGSGKVFKLRSRSPVMRKTTLLSALLVVLFFLLVASQASALSIISADIPDVAPGEVTELSVLVKNTLERDVEDVSVALNLQGLPFNTIGSSEATVREIEEDESERFVFSLRASPTAAPGDYQIPFTATYKNASKSKTGTFGVRIKGSVDLSVLATAEKPVIGQKDKLTLKVINKGTAEARYVALTLFPSGLSLASDSTVYIGDISADDFESAVFDVLYETDDPVIEARMEYRDFNNALQVQRIVKGVETYTREEAIKRGIIKRDYTLWYILGVVLLIALWLLWRSYRRRQRMKRSMQAQR